jgi:hypothetical protein
VPEGALDRLLEHLGWFERIDHILAGARRCAYRVREIRAAR